MRDPRSGLNLPFAMLFAALVAIGLIAGSVYLAIEIIGGGTPAPRPVSLLPRQPEGITIMLRAPDEPIAEAPSVSPPKGTAGSTGAQLWGVDLGGAGSFTDLSKRFERLARENAEMPFEQLEPRAIITETEIGLEARLLVGPFGSAEVATVFCDNIALPAGIICIAAPFDGERIARQ